MTYIGRTSKSPGDPPGTELEDGFGSFWRTCNDERCDLQVVRPGKVQCSDYCQIAGFPDDDDDLRPWRVGSHYGIHIYADDGGESVPIATAMTTAAAEQIVREHNAAIETNVIRP